MAAGAVSNVHKNLHGFKEVREKVTSLVDPTADDDSTQYYTHGSIWINTVLFKLWVCMDPAAGAAVWKVEQLS
jgi:hypothetical protein